jgi:putative ABC transport system permease protein
MTALERSVLLPAEHILETNDSPIDTLVVNGWDPATSAEVVPLKPIAGRWFKPGDEHVVMVRETLTQRTGLTLGDSIQLPAAGGTTRLEIVGILPESPLLGDEAVYIPLGTAQSVFNQPGQINSIAAQFEPDNDYEAIRQTVLERLGPNYDAGAIDSGGQEMENFFQMMNAMLTMLGVLALAMGGFIMFNTFRTAVVERKRDVGMLRAIGASRRTVMGLILTEGLIQGIVGTVGGMLAGYLLAKLIVQQLNLIYEEYMRISLGDPSFTVQTYILTVALGLGLPLISGLLPALSASRVMPLEALRPSVDVVDWRSFGKRTLWGVMARRWFIPSLSYLADYWYWPLPERASWLGGIWYASLDGPQLRL